MYWVRGVNETGDPVDLAFQVCWRCGAPVVTSVVSMEEHVDRFHPVPRHAAAEEDAGPPPGPPPVPLPDLWRGYPGPIPAP